MPDAPELLLASVVVVAGEEPGKEMENMKDTGKVSYELQVGEDKTGFWMTLTISAGGRYWTSAPARLSVTDMDAAVGEANRQTRLLSRVMRGE